jgi:hypothetical protein
MVAFLKHRTKISRPVAAADVTLDNIRAIKPILDWQKNHEDVEPPEIDMKNMARTCEAIREYFKGCLGLTGVPLSYAIRENILVIAAADDPATNYESFQDELIARAPIKDANDAFTAAYLADRATVWEKIANMTREKDCFTYVRPAQAQRDGRKAVLGLEGHYLGINNVDNMAVTAEAAIQNAVYRGESRRFDFERYVKIHVDNFNITKNLVTHGYSPMDERSRVRHLMTGIKTDKLDSVKLQIMSDAGLRNDFDRCVNLYKDFITQMHPEGSNGRNANISSVTTGNEGGKDPEDRYYSAEEYMKLTDAQKLILKEKRSARGHVPLRDKRQSNKGKRFGKGTGKGVKENANHKGNLNLSKATIRALSSSMISALKKRKQDDDDTSVTSASTEDTPTQTNRHNAALRRKKKHKE